MLLYVWIWPPECEAIRYRIELGVGVHFFYKFVNWLSHPAGSAKHDWSMYPILFIHYSTLSSVVCVRYERDNIFAFDLWRILSRVLFTEMPDNADSWSPSFFKKTWTSRNYKSEKSKCVFWPQKEEQLYTLERVKCSRGHRKSVEIERTPENEVCFNSPRVSRLTKETVGFFPERLFVLQ